jgi:hypothetical protein
MVVRLIIAISVSLGFRQGVAQSPIFRDVPTTEVFNGVIVDANGHCQLSRKNRNFTITTRKGEPCYDSSCNLVINFRDFADRNEILAIRRNKVLISNWPDTIVQCVVLFNFDAKVGQSWTINRGMPWSYFHHLSSRITFKEKQYDMILSDTVYHFEIDGDYATRHATYVKDWYVSKRLGFIRIDYESASGDDGRRGYYFAESYLRRQKIKKYVKANILKKAAN